MRKYYQLLLVVVACISVVLLLVYERKYTKVKLVLELMNSFGSPLIGGTAAPTAGKSGGRGTHSDWNPSWTEVGPGLFVYSAFWDDARPIPTVKVIALAWNDIDDYQCMLWYGDLAKMTPGTMEYHKLDSVSGSFAAYIFCSPGNTTAYPTGISFASRGQALHHMQPWIIPVQRPTSGVPDGMTVCVEPLGGMFNNVWKLVEFIEYHRHVGASHFNFYDAGLGPGAREVLLHHVREAGISAEILPWNVPYDLMPQAETLFLHDCAHRASKNHQFLLKLNVSQFLVPKKNFSLSETLEHLYALQEHKVTMLKFRVFQFCLEYPSDIIAESLKFPFIILLKNWRSPVTSNMTPVAFHASNFIHSAESTLVSARPTDVLVPKSMAVLHLYSPCYIQSIIKRNLVTDVSLFNMKNMLFKSPLYHLLNERKPVNF